MEKTNKNIILTSRQYNVYKFRKPLGEGTQAKVYTYNKTSVIKLWKDDISLFALPFYQRNVEYLQDFKYHSLILPEKLVYVDDNIVGYTMHYFAGVNLMDLKDESSMRHFLLALKRLEKAVLDISKHLVILDDTHNENIMYYQKMDKGLLTCVDCDTWKKDSLKSVEECYKISMRRIAYTINKTLIDSEELQDFVISNNNLSEQYEKLLYLSNSDIYDFLRSLIIELQKYTNEQIETVGDLRRVLK